ncbi:MAG: ATP-binding protein [Bryobacterales bacterium]
MMNTAPPVAADDITYGTTRVIRIYEQGLQEAHLMRRIDWQLPLDTYQQDALDQHATLLLQRRRKPFTHVVIRDIHYRVLRPAIVDAIKTACAENAKWYIATREWLPSWFQNLTAVRDNVELVLIPELAALSASRKEHFSWVRQGYASMMGMELLDRLAGKNPDPDAQRLFDSQHGGHADALLQSTTFPNANIVVVPESLSVLAREAGGEHGFLRHATVSTDHKFVPRASVFFPALSARLIFRDSVAPVEMLPEARRFEADLRWATGYTQQWMREERQRLSARNWKFHERMPSVDLAAKLVDDDWKNFASSSDYPDDRSTIVTSPVRWHFPWTRAKSHWKEALVEGSNGVIEGKFYGPQLEVFRAMTHVDGFVCVDVDKRAHLYRLVEHAKGLLEARGSRRHRSVAIIDFPGNGKTHLMKRLARTVGLRLIEFNITQLRSEDDLLHCFDSILDSQAKNEHDLHLIFFDEINALLQGQQVYRAFLSVLEDGYYLRAGNQFHVRPAFWVFAGTAYPAEPPPSADSAASGDHGARSGPDDSRYAESKWADFRSRLTLGVVDFRKGGPRSNLESVYIGAELIRSEYPDVTKISRGALEGLGRLGTSEKGLRRLRHMIRSLHDVQDSVITADNFDEDVWRDYGLGREQLAQLIADRDLVDIVWRSARTGGPR